LHFHITVLFYCLIGEKRHRISTRGVTADLPVNAACSDVVTEHQRMLATASDFRPSSRIISVCSCGSYFPPRYVRRESNPTISARTAPYRTSASLWSLNARTRKRVPRAPLKACSHCSDRTELKSVVKVSRNAPERHSGSQIYPVSIPGPLNK